LFSDVLSLRPTDATRSVVASYTACN